MKRQDLQGLRGIAIGSVLLFHFFPATFPNGYVGVDIFYVLSGFLMTMIFGSKPISKNSIALFYKRRIKRIMPLYMAVIVTVLLLLFFLFPPTFRSLNLFSSLHAITLTSNMATSSDSYFVQLNQADDLFTHTWSLAVEMQFYVLVPALFILFSMRFSSLSFTAIFSASLGFHLFSSPHNSFNNVFARIWQFQAGICAFYAGKYLAEYIDGRRNGDKTALLEEEGEAKEVSSSPSRSTSSTLPLYLLHSLCLLLLLIFAFSSLPLSPSAARLPSTCHSALLISLGSVLPKNPLNFRFLVYLGDISYGFYLVHWPVYVWVKFFYKDDLYAYIMAICFCFIISVAIAETFEKWYTRLEMKFIYVLIICLYLASTAIVFETESLAKLADGNEQKLPIDGILSKNYTTEEAIYLNNQYDRFEYPNLVQPNCHPNNSEHGFCSFAEGKGSYKILILGNSYTPNLADLVYDNFHNIGSNISKYSNSYCEALLKNKDKPQKCAKSYKEYFRVAIEFKPDLLFLINRHMVTDRAMDAENVENDTTFRQIWETVGKYESVTSTRVFILDAIPKVHSDHIRRLNSMIRTGKFDEISLNPVQTFKIAQSRMKLIGKKCSKCTIFDFNSVLSLRNETITFDRKTKLSFFTGGVHLTAAGKEAVRGVFEELAENFMKNRVYNGSTTSDY